MIPFFMQIDKYGEDAPPVHEPQYSIVCDGMGGAGAHRHSIPDSAGGTSDHTSAHLGSRIVSESAQAFYRDNMERMKAIVENNNWEALLSVIKELKTAIERSLSDRVKEWNIALSQSRAEPTFPTTLASAMFFQNDSNVKILAIWAGDSRVYGLTPKNGLQALSKDDTGDAESMNAEGSLSNFISASQPFKLNYAVYEFSEPGIFFCCSDGIYKTWDSPLEFESFLIEGILDINDTILPASIGETFARQLERWYGSNPLDDTTISGVFHNTGFGLQCKTDFRKRKNDMADCFKEMEICLSQRKALLTELNQAYKECCRAENGFLKICRRALDEVYETSVADQGGAEDQLRGYSFYEELRTSKMNHGTVEEQYSDAMRNLDERIKKQRERCKANMLDDYMINPPSVSCGKGASFIRERKARKAIAGTFPDRESCVLAMNICVEMVKYDRFFRWDSMTSVFFDPDKWNEAFMGMGKLLQEPDPNIDSFVRHAYCRTPQNASERDRLSKTPDFNKWFDGILKGIRDAGGLSEESKEELDELKKLEREKEQTQTAYNEAKQRSSSEALDQIWRRHKNEIVDLFVSHPEYINGISEGIREEERGAINSYINGKKDMSSYQESLKKVEDQKEAIWEKYKQTYQMFDKHAIMEVF